MQYNKIFLQTKNLNPDQYGQLPIVWEKAKMNLFILTKNI